MQPAAPLPGCCLQITHMQCIVWQVLGCSYPQVSCKRMLQHDTRVATVHNRSKKRFQLCTNNCTTFSVLYVTFQSQLTCVSSVEGGMVHSRCVACSRIASISLLACTPGMSAVEVCCNTCVDLGWPKCKCAAFYTCSNDHRQLGSHAALELSAFLAAPNLCMFRTRSWEGLTKI